MQVHSNASNVAHAPKAQQNLASQKVNVAKDESLAAEKPAGGGRDIPAAVQAKEGGLGNHIDFKA
jgi:hypothetical protein